jgi:hypothetical protein
VTRRREPPMRVYPVDGSLPRAFLRLTGWCIAVSVVLASHAALFALVALWTPAVLSGEVPVGAQALSIPPILAGLLQSVVLFRFAGPLHAAGYAWRYGRFLLGSYFLTLMYSLFAAAVYLSPEGLGAIAVAVTGVAVLLMAASNTPLALLADGYFRRALRDPETYDSRWPLSYYHPISMAIEQGILRVRVDAKDALPVAPHHRRAQL